MNVRKTNRNANGCRIKNASLEARFFRLFFFGITVTNSQPKLNRESWNVLMESDFHRAENEWSGCRAYNFRCAKDWTNWFEAICNSENQLDFKWQKMRSLLISWKNDCTLFTQVTQMQDRHFFRALIIRMTGVKKEENKQPDNSWCILARAQKKPASRFEMADAFVLVLMNSNFVKAVKKHTKNSMGKMQHKRWRKKCTGMLHFMFIRCLSFSGSHRKVEWR